MGAQEVAKAVSPRYHFVPSRESQFLQRAPFSAPPMSSAAVLFTRFVAVATVSDSSDKQRKWLHALSLVPARALLASGSPKDLAQLQVGGVLFVGASGLPYSLIRSLGPWFTPCTA